MKNLRYYFTDTGQINTIYELVELERNSSNCEGLRIITLGNQLASHSFSR